MPKVITIAGREYLVRYPVGALIRAETHLGKSLGEIDWNNASFRDMSILTRYGLHTTDGKPISEEMYDNILDEVSLVEFTPIFRAVAEELVPKETVAGKN